MNNAKRGALRFALCLHCVGIFPMCVGQTYREQFAALLTHYQSLDIEATKKASQLGREAIRNGLGLEKASEGLLPPIMQQLLVDRKQIAPAIEQMPHKEMFQRIRSRWLRQTTPFPSCRMGSGFPKRSWPGREMAEEIRLTHHNRGTPYLDACPAQREF